VCETHSVSVCCAVLPTGADQGSYTEKHIEMVIERSIPALVGGDSHGSLSVGNRANMSSSSSNPSSSQNDNDHTHSNDNNMDLGDDGSDVVNSDDVAMVDERLESFAAEQLAKCNVR
jgi:hypothetical protein